MSKIRNPRNVTEKADLLKLNPKWLTQKHEKQLRQKVIEAKKEKLLAAVKIPPAINQFKKTITTEQFDKLNDILKNYLPETKKERKQRLQNNNGKLDTKPIFVKGGAKHVVKLIEQENTKVKLVMIAGDVDPIELVLFIPTLCKHKNISYCIIPTQKMLGKFIGKKRTTVACIEDVRGDDKAIFEKLIKEFNTEYLDNYNFHMKTWGNIN